MQISVEQSSVLERRLTVEIPEERIASEVQTRLESLSKNARIHGFRQGKAPFKVVRQQFGARVRNEIVAEMMRSSFSEAVTKEELKPVGQPVIDPVATSPGAGLRYTATFEVFPTVELAPIESLALVRAQCEIGEVDIRAMVDKLRAQHREWIGVERPARLGDLVTIDFAGSVDGVPFEGGTGSDFELELGLGSMLDGFEDGLLGHAAGAVVGLDLRFPEPYRRADLAGKAVCFEVTVKRVAEALLPAVDQSFFEKFGVREGGEAAFHTEVRQNIERERDRALRQRFTSEVMAKLAAANDVALPSTLVHAEFQRLAQQAAREMMMRGLNPGDAPAPLQQALQAQAEHRVKLGLIMAEIVKRAGLRADPVKVRQTLEQMAASYEDPAAVVKWYYDNPQQLQQIEGLCLEDEVVNWIAQRAQLTTESVSFDALMNPGQTDTQPEASS